MSSHKRRKIDTPNTPTGSAVSAIAARRQLASSASASASASTQPADDALSENEDDLTPVSSKNAFSALRELRSKSATATTPKKTGPRTPQGRPDEPGRRGDARPLQNSKESRRESTPDVPGAKQKVTQYSSFRLSKANHRVRPNGIIELKLTCSERFMVLGSYGIQVQTGEISIAGAVLRPSDKTYWVHAPHCHAVPVLRSAEHTRVQLHPDPRASGLRQLQRLSPLFRDIWEEPLGLGEEEQSGRSSTFQMIFTSDDVPRRALVQDLVSPPAWNKKLASLSADISSNKSASIFVCGPKSAGKSTFSRLLLNRLLTNGLSQTSETDSRDVALLDLDPGQPEYTPSGMLSLVRVTSPNLGTPFTHPTPDVGSGEVIRSHALAAVSPATAPGLHLEAAADLFNTYLQRLSECCLIINTPGWILGTGLDLLTDLITSMHPGQVVYMSEDGPADTVDALREATSGTFTMLPSQQSEFTSRTSAHFRAMQTMSYFHQARLPGSNTGPGIGWEPSPLSRVAPWVVTYTGPSRGVFAILSYDFQPPPSLMAETINGAILSVIEVEHPKAFGDLLKATTNYNHVSEADHRDYDVSFQSLESLVSQTPEDIPYLSNHDDVALDPRYSRAIGLALVRGIDTSTKSLQLLSPMTPDTIATSRRKGTSIVLLHGKFDSPTWAYTEDLYERSGPAPRESESGNGLEIADEDTSEDDSEDEPQRVEEASDMSTAPWVEVLKGNEKRPVGSKVWRVRRDLGRNPGAD